MVKQGDIANMLIKPVNMITYFIVEDFSLIIKACINGTFAIILGFTLAGKINLSVQSVIMTIIASSIGIFIGVLLQVFIGIISFYTEENNSIYLIVQKILSKVSTENCINITNNIFCI